MKQFRNWILALVIGTFTIVGYSTNTTPILEKKTDFTKEVTIVKAIVTNTEIKMVETLATRYVALPDRWESNFRNEKHSYIKQNHKSTNYIKTLLPNPNLNYKRARDSIRANSSKYN